MGVLSYFIAASAPGLALMVYFYLKDRYVLEPIPLVLKMFVFGLLIVLPTMVVQRGFVLAFSDHPIVFAFVWTALIEETVKWLLVFHLIFSHASFDEPYNGIVYAVAVSLGYATLENIIFAWYYNPTIFDMIMRALLPVSGHALFGVMMGYYFGKAKFNPSKRTFYLLLALGSAVFWHGLFDYIILTQTDYWVAIVFLMTFLWFRSVRRVNKANDRSPYRTLSAEARD